MAGINARTMVAGGVAGLGLAIGGLAVATADDGSTSPSAPRAEQGLRADGDRGPFGGHHRIASELAADLADELGVSEDAVREAWEAVRDDVLPQRPHRFEPGEGFEPPTDAEVEDFQDQLAGALAAELDLPEADVEAALETVRAEAEQRFEERAEEWRGEAREDLVERLDDAVADGDLTQADERSVLKAFDAGVLGGGPGGFGPGFRGPR